MKRKQTKTYTPISCIAYYRVSTDKQGIRGLGMQAQQDVVAAYLASQSLPLIASYQEVESGARSDRPQLDAALAACRDTRSRLIIAKLDRLSRDTEFVSALLKGDVPFTCCDMPGADKTMLQLMSVMAEWERDQIAKRTRAAMAAAKDRGVKYGNPHATTRALERAKQLEPLIREAQQAGHTSIRALALHLAMHPTQVRRALGYINQIQTTNGQKTQ